MKTHLTTRPLISYFLRTLLFVTLVLGMHVGPSYAQQSLAGTTTAGTAPGSPAGSYSLSGFETINPYSGNLNFSLPLLQVAGRGGMTAPVKLTLNQKWIAKLDPNEYNGSYYYYVEDHWWNDWFTTDKGYSPGSVVGRHTGEIGTCILNGVAYYNPSLTRLTFTTPDGTEHDLVDQYSYGQPFNTGFCPAGNNFARGTVFVTTDGTHATFISDEPIPDELFPTIPGLIRPNGLLMTADGTHYGVEDGRIKWQRDRNGNKLFFEYEACCDQSRISKITDSLNREVHFQYGVTDGNFGLCDKITYKGFGGEPRIIRISYEDLNLVLRAGSSPQTGQQLFPSVYNSAAPPGSTVHQLANATYNPSRVSQVWLPDGIRSYKLRYNSYGELARVELPTGGAIEYDWVDAIALGSGGLPGIVYDPGTSVYRRVTERRVYTNGSTLDNKTVWGPPEFISGRTGYVMEDQYDASGARLGRAKHYFTGIQNPSSPPVTSNAYPFYQSWQDGKEYQTELFHTDGTTVLRRITHTWTQATNPPWYSGHPDHAPENNPHITETLTTLVDTNQVSKQTFAYDQFSNLTDSYEFDYGPGAPASQPSRHSHTDYLTTNPAQNNIDYTSTDIHIRNLPTQQSVFEGTTERARITYEYDNYSTQAPNHWSLLARNNISGYDPTFNSTARGNVTAITQYLFNNGTPIGSISAYTQYDIAGNVVKTIDARGYETIRSYDDCFGGPNGNAQIPSAPLELSSVSHNSFAFVTKVTNALNQISFAQFDYYTGRAVDSEDINGVVSSSYSENDFLDRPTKVISASYPETSAKSQTKFTYDDANRIVTTTSDHNSFNDPYALKSQTFYDGLGRTVETRTYEGGSNYIAVQQQYDALGRPHKTSNPFRNNETPDWTISGFDSLGRVVSVTTPDQAVINTSYSGNTVTVTDQAGKKRRSVTDGLGRLTRVDEPDASNNLGSVSSPVQPISYGYDVLDNLLTVTQGTQPERGFVYDSLKRLTSASNPESGTVNYQYDNNGNLLIKTDTRGVSTHFSYDALNRPIRRWYNGSNNISDTINNSPALPAGVGASEEANYFYDSQALPAGAPSYARGSATGRLVATTYGTGNSSGDYFAYDVRGRATLKIQQIGGINYQVQRTYNRASAVVGQTYPSGRAVSYAYDPAGRAISSGGNLGDGIQRTYTSTVLYSPFGGIQKERLGTDTAIYNKSFYNLRGQLSELRVSTSYTGPSDTNRNRGSIINNFSVQCAPGSGVGCNGTDNNGNLTSQQVFIPHDDAITSSTSWYQKFDYDELNRLLRAKEYNSANTQLWQQEYFYDRWGNRRIHQTNTWGGPNIPKPNFDLEQSTNRLYAPGDLALSETLRQMRYDGAGNLKKDSYTGAGDREHDAENKMTKAWADGQWQYYTYDADGKRVIRKVDGVGTWQIYGLDGELLAEYSVNASTRRAQKEYGYRNGKLLAKANVPIFNVARDSVGATATASSTLTTGGLTYSHNHAINGTRYPTFTNDIWLDATFNSFPDWIQINFNGHRTISEIDIFTTQADANNWVEPTPTQTFAPNGGITNFVVQYWSDSGWITVNGGSITGNDKVWRMIDFAPVTTTKIKVTVNDGLTHDLSRIAEIEAWGYSAIQIPTLGDDFDDNVRDTNKWNLYTVGPNPSPTYEQNGRLEIQSQYSATDSNYGGYVTATTHNLNGKQTSVEVVQPTTNNGGGGNYAGLSWGDSPYKITMTYHYIYYDNSGFYFDPARDRYIRLRDDPATQTVYYESSANGVSWEVRASRFRGAASLDYAVRLYNGNTAGWTSVDLVIFDNFRLEPIGLQVVGNNVNWLVADHLGSPRMVLDQSGSLAAVKRNDYLPFGEELGKGQGLRTSGLGYSKSSVRQKFTSKERDNETGLDYFGARYYSSTQGRFTSVDPMNAGAGVGQPQSWNGYAYAFNNPLKYQDRDGLSVRICGTDGRCTDDGTDLSDENFNRWFRDDKSIRLRNGKIFKNGELIGTYENRGIDGAPFSRALMQAGNQPYEKGVMIFAGTSLFLGTVAGVTVYAAPALMAAGGATFANGVTRAALEAAASDAGPTVQVVTRLTQAPQVGRALSAAAGEGAAGLSNAMRTGGQLYTANIPKALLETLRTAGLVEQRVTQAVNGARAVEYYFRPEAAEFIVRFFH